jgi:hypothetical protein
VGPAFFQVRFYKAQETVTCVALSLDGALVAAGQVHAGCFGCVWTVVARDVPGYFIRLASMGRLKFGALLRM